MDYKILLAAFWGILVAELADKTQLVTLGLASKSGKPWSVFVGSIAGYAVVMTITVLLGATLGKYVKPELIRYAGGVIFIVMGFLFLFNKI